jgi:glycerophosphoryl diester phosphodiesterase
MICPMKTLSFAFVAVVAAACAVVAAAPPDLSSSFDCLRQRHLALVAAHRGQPDPSAPENAMSSFAASVAAGVPFLEIDIATTRDGALVLMHDDSLDRTTTGTGLVGDRTLAEVRAVKLRKADGTVLDEGVPRLDEVLAWGRKAGAYFELDFKKTTDPAVVLEAVRAAGMEDRVMVVTYTLADARNIQRLAPKAMISVSMEHAGDFEAARKALDTTRILGWMGIESPSTGRLAALLAAGVEPIVGTLGRAGVRLDDLYAADGNPSEYFDLVRAGVVMIASDRAVEAQRVIGPAYKGCLQ